jgi:microcystin degradation protein MlrC
MSRIAVGGFLHETNSFVSPANGFAPFEQATEKPHMGRGAEFLQRLAGSTFGIAGFLDAMAARHELVPLVWASATAGGTVTREAFERVAAELVGALSQAMPVDAVYLDLHGAMVSEDFDDGEGELLRRVRAAVGEQVPVVIDLDYHANVTDRMVAMCDGIAAFETYPHVDRAQTGARAAAILEQVLARGRPSARAHRKAQFLIPLNGQCTLIEPSRGIVQCARAQQQGEVLSAAYLAGFPPSDTCACGPSIAVHGYEQQAVDAAADAVAVLIADHEGDFLQPMLPPGEAVARAMRIAAGASRPVILADTQDNPGAGGTADTTGLLYALLEAGVDDAVIGVMWDPQVAEQAAAAGEGATVRASLGGKSGPPGVRALDGEFAVLRVADGRFRTTGPSVGGRDIDIGPMALLRIGGVRIVVSARRMQAFDQSVFRHVGVEPAHQRILCLKSTVHFLADFGPLAEEVQVVLAPGAHVVDTTTYPYRKLRAGVRLHPHGPAFAGA